MLARKKERERERKKERESEKERERERKAKGDRNRGIEEQWTIFQTLYLVRVGVSKHCTNCKIDYVVHRLLRLNSRPLSFYSIGHRWTQKGKCRLTGHDRDRKHYNTREKDKHS